MKVNFEFEIPDESIVSDQMAITTYISPDGKPYWATLACKGDSKDLVDFMVGLGMIESLKFDFLERHTRVSDS